MLNLRLYRLTVVLGLFSVVVLMFSLATRPDPLTSELSTAGFSGDDAARIATTLIEVAPDRAPGSTGDDKAADFVAKQLTAIPGASVNERRFKGKYRGDDVELRNVVAVLPGQTNATIVIAAPRDCAAGVCAASSAASTGALVELGTALADSQHQKTIELVSLDGSAAGAAGAAQLAEELRSEPARAVIVLYQPGAKMIRGASVIPFSDSSRSTAAQLTESATRAVEAERKVSGSPGDGTLSDLLRLAVPAATGDQGPLIAAGSDAISLASAGDLPLPESADGPKALSATTLGEVGRSALGLSFAIDGSSEPFQHGPTTYIPLAGKLIPGWALSFVAFALLLPIGILGVDGCIRAWRRRDAVLLALAWVLSRAGCFFAGVLLAYFLAIIGIVPRPSWPFNPAEYDVGLGEIFVVLLLVAAVAGAAWGARLFRLPDAADEAVAPVIVSVLFLAGLAIWVANPFLALLLVPTFHLWLFAARPDLRGRYAVVIPAAIAGLLLPLLAILALGDRLDSGSALPWQLLLIFTGGHFGFLVTIPICLLAGCLMALLVVAATRPVTPQVVKRRTRKRPPRSGPAQEPPLRTIPGTPRGRSGGSLF